MTEIERKALELVNEVQEDENYIVPSLLFSRSKDAFCEALCRAIEQHEAFRQEVSDVAEHLCRFYGVPVVMDKLEPFIITKPDPLVEAMRYITTCDDAKAAEQLRGELAKRGLEIREKKND